MKIVGEYMEGKLSIELTGELDHHAAREVMQESGRRIDMYLPRYCKVDMTGIKFMDSSGIAYIVRMYKRMKEIGGTLKIEGVQGQPARVLTASGISRLIEIGVEARR